MIKRIINMLIVLSIMVTYVSAVPANASETYYAPTSALNGGWKNDYVKKQLIAEAKLGSKPEMNGMTAQIGDDSAAVTVSRMMGREGWVLSPDLGESARFINADIDNKTAYNIADGSSYAVEVDYYDEGISSLTLEYPSMKYTPLIQAETAAEITQPALNNSVKTSEGEYLVFNNTGVWRSYTWFLDNPTFSDSLNGFDFRVGIYSGMMGYSRDGEVTISAIRVYRLETASRIKIENDTSEHFGNIFYDGEEIELSASFSSEIYPIQNQLDGDYPLDVTYTVRDGDGNVVWRGTDNFTLPMLSKTVRKKKLNVDKFGIYRVDIDAYCKDKKIYSRLGSEFSYVHSDKGKTVNPHSGVQIALLNVKDEKIAQLARNAGIPKARMMCYYNNWRKSAEQYEVNNVSMAEGYKSLFRAFKKAGLDIDANLHSASWMGAAYNFSPIERTPPYTEDGLRRWSEYCAMMAELLGDTVECFEIWNEYNLGPNHSFNMENRPASDYAKMYIASKKAIKAVNPNIPVVGLNTSGAPKVWTEEVLQAGATDMDVFSIHPYQWYGDPITYDTLDSIEYVAKLFEKYGAKNVPIWITEYGYSSHYESVNTDIEQGMYNAQTYAMVMSQGYVDRFYYYCLLDKANAVRTDRESNFGMVRCDMSNPQPYMVPYAAKPAYLIISNMNMMYHDAEFGQTLKPSETSRVVRSRHKGTEKQTAMLFSNKADGELVTLRLGTDTVTLYDAYGNAKKIKGEKGVYSLNLSKNVQYIEGNFKDFEITQCLAAPETANLDVIYGENARINIVNKTGKKISARVLPYAESEVKVNEAVIDKDGGFVEINGGNAVSGTERVNLTLYDNTGVYYCSDVYINYKNNVELDTTMIPLDTGWSMRCSLTNLSDKKSKTGRLTLLTPIQWQESVADVPVELAPGEKKVFDLSLPVGTSADDRVIEVAFIVDESSKFGSYVSKNYNFSAALHAKMPIVIDGNGKEWTDGFITLNRSDQFHSLLSLGSSYAGADDLSVKAAVKWDDDNFYFYADVLDNKHFSANVQPVNIWQMDSIQLAIVYDPKSELKRGEFEEIAIGELNGEPVIYRHKTRFTGEEDYTKVPGSELAVVPDGLHTYYELKIPWSSLMVQQVKIEPGTELKFAMVVNENDGVGRVGYLALGDGIVSTKNSSLFKRLYIRD